MADDQQQGTVETRADYEKDPAKFVAHWLQALELAGDEEKKWRDDAEKTIKRYRAEEGLSDYNTLFSNVETTVPALYNSEPLPDVRRRFGDEDPIGKAVATVIERAISIQTEMYDFSACMKAAVKDSELAGRGVSRIRLGVGEGENPSHWLSCEPIQYDDFRRGPAKLWADVPWLSYTWKFTREELEAISPEVGSLVTLDASTSSKPQKDHSNLPDMFKRATVYEIWDKSTRKVYFIAESYKGAPLSVQDDPYKLRDFFPTPEPLYAVTTTNTLVPGCGYTPWRKLAEGIDNLTRRISALVKVIKWKGIYAGSDETAINALKGLEDGELAPAPDSARMMSQGGIDKAIWLMPVEQAAKTVQTLYEARERAKQALYEQTGIADIMRGSSDANETLGAQQIKTQWGSLRIQARQQDVQRYARDFFRMMADLFGQFTFEELMAMTGSPLPAPPQQPPQMGHNGGPPMEGGAPQPGQAGPPQPQQPPGPPPIDPVVWQAQAAQQMKAMLQNDLQREFGIDIETDSTIRGDLTRDQQNAGGFVQGFASFTQAVMPAIQAGIMPPQVAVQLAISFSRLFKLGRTGELALEEWGKNAEEAAKNPPPKQPTPEEIKAKGEEQRLAADMKKHQDEMAARGQEHQDNTNLEYAKLAQGQTQHRDSLMASDASQQRDHQHQTKEAEVAHQRGTETALTKFRGDKHMARMAAGERDIQEVDDMAPDELRAMLEGMQSQSAAMQQSTQQLAQAVLGMGESIKQGLGQLAQATLAETEIVRGPDGKPAGARKVMMRSN